MSARTNIPGLDAAAGVLARAKHVTVLTGAGVSAESGLRTFRGSGGPDLPPDMRALWKEFDPMRLATPEAFAADPATVTRWYDWRRIGCLAAEPNPGHRALTDLERQVAARGGRFTLLTQNVDRLHQKAGSRNVVELHGSIIEWRCTRTGRKLTPTAEPFEAFPLRSPFDAGALLRPDVVWFGEALPASALEAAQEAVESCDVFMSVGTSSVVFPAAGLVGVAAAHGAATIEVNRERTPISAGVTHVLLGASGELLPRLVAAAP